MKLAFHTIQSGKTSPNGDIFDWIISKQCHSPIVHVELVTEDSVLQNASCFSSVPGPGCRFTKIDLTTSEWVLIGVSPADPKRVVESACGMVGQRYDWMGIIGFGLPFSQHLDWDKFCSEAVVTALQAGGLFKEVVPWKTSPADLYKLVK